MIIENKNKITPFILKIEYLCGSIINEEG